MFVGRDFDPADPGESEVYTFDFTRDLGEGETVESVVFEIGVVEGSDDEVEDRLDGAAVIDEDELRVSQRLSGLVAGCRYQLRALATTSADNILSLFSFVSVQTLETEEAP